MLIEKVIQHFRRKLKRKIKTPESFKKEFDLFNSLDKEKRFVNRWEHIQPCLKDNTSETFIDAHYIYHPAWAMRIVKSINPAIHYDISSTLHFSTQLSAFIPTRFYDFRPAKLNLSDFVSESADLNSLPFAAGSIDSISCMHTVEHIGLGRYGDQIDPEGDIRAFEELKRVVSPKGNLLIVVPLGKPSIRFNAHRIYSYEMISAIFDQGFECKEFSFVDDLGRFTRHASPSVVKYSSFGCGCFWFIKK